MAYYIDLFSPETHKMFTNSNQNVSGFRERQRSMASLIKPGDKFICYMTKLSRWVGVLEITEPFFIDNTPLFQTPEDPFTIRFKVNPLVWLSPENAIPIVENICWNNLSFTKSLPKKSRAWTGIIRGSLRKLDDKDGEYLEKILLNQLHGPQKYELNPSDKKHLSPSLVNDNCTQTESSALDSEEVTRAPLLGPRESHIIQAMLAKIGERMGFKIWLPRNDQGNVLEIWQPKRELSLLKQLPFKYETASQRTIENIDVLWIHNLTIKRAFEVEQTTSIYSGILRMADLMALQPNLSIKAHIVASIDRRAKVLEEISRPAFNRGDNPLSESCTYLSYDAVKELLENENLEHMREDILEKYAEYAEETDV